MSACLQTLGAGPGVGHLASSNRALPVGETLAEGEIVGRFVMSSPTREEPVERLIALIAA